MNVSDALRKIINQRGSSQTTVAESLGVSQPAVASVLAVGNPQTRVLVGMLDSLDYNLVAMPAEEDLPYNGIVITVDEH